MLLHCGAGTCSGAKGDVAWSGTVTVPLSVSPVVAQRLRKLDFPVKDSEAPSAPGTDKNHFPRPRGPGEDAGEVSAHTVAELLPWGGPRAGGVACGCGAPASLASPSGWSSVRGQE